MDLSPKFVLQLIRAAGRVLTAMRPPERGITRLWPALALLLSMSACQHENIFLGVCISSQRNEHRQEEISGVTLAGLPTSTLNMDGQENEKQCWPITGSIAFALYSIIVRLVVSAAHQWLGSQVHL